MTALLFATAMVALAVVGAVWSRLGSLLLVVASAGWIVADVRPEGPVLWSITDSHGVVLADLWGVLCLLVGGALLVRGPGRSRRGR
ncbi:MAG: hypothetical protein GEU96_06025 [Propionibacteriales bacterium]|nr:hypothetical protein [Propionibacteriales bacterium]